MRKLQLAVLSTGSKGNCYWVSDGQTSILIDAGLTLSKAKAAMKRCGRDLGPIAAILVTHLHGDHAGNARVLAKKLNAPVWMSRGTLRGLTDADLGRKKQLLPDTKRIRALSPAVLGRGAFRVGTLDVEYIEVPHDAPGTVAYRVGHRDDSPENGVWVGVLTDFSIDTRDPKNEHTNRVSSFLSDLSIAVLEFNHDVDMLRECEKYHDLLKERIFNTHMNNQDSGDLLVMADPPMLEHLVTGHTSERANCPEIVKAAAEKSVDLLSVAAFIPPTLHIGRQEGLTSIFSVDLPPCSL
jgi:phosphoribosyl 1,2-cyclic phosphodiesterase